MKVESLTTIEDRIPAPAPYACMAGPLVWASIPTVKVESEIVGDAKSSAIMFEPLISVNERWSSSGEEPSMISAPYLTVLETLSRTLNP